MTDEVVLLKVNKQGRMTVPREYFSVLHLSKTSGGYISIDTLPNENVLVLRPVEIRKK